jgi:integrase/recombinase XerC
MNTWGTAIAGWDAHARASGAPETTRRTRRDHLGRLARRIGADPWGVTADELLEYVNGQGWANETRRAHRTTMRVFYAWALEAGHVSVSPAAGLPKVAPAPPRPRPTPDRVHATALLVADARELLMIRLATEVGLRRGEIALVHSRDLLEDLTGWSLLVHGKGGKERVLPLPDTLAAALQRLEPGWAFPGRVGGHLSPRWVGTLLSRVLGEGWTAHTLRHRFATRTYEGSGYDVFSVQELLGHASPVTTRRYVAVGRDRLRRIVEEAAA